MIKVIKHGNKKVTTCKECGCEFSYEKEDVKWGDQRDPYSEVICPDCGHRCDTNGKY